jgi:hypothetical protein
MFWATSAHNTAAMFRDSQSGKDRSDIRNSPEMYVAGAIQKKRTLL